MDCVALIVTVKPLVAPTFIVKVAGSSDVIANPADDHKTAVFDKGLHDKTDRYVLKFSKPK